MLRPIEIEHLAGDHFEIALGAPMSAAQVAAVEADHDRGRHRVDVRIGSSGGTQPRYPLTDAVGSIAHRAGVDGTADRQQLGEKTCRSCEWCKGGELRGQIGKFRRYAAVKSQRREAFWPLLSVLTSATHESPNSERHVAEQRSKGHAPISLAGQIQPAMPTRSEMLTHRRCLRADHLSLDSRGNSFALIQRQAERLRNRPILPFYSSHLDLARWSACLGHKFHPPNQLPHSAAPCQRPGA